MSRFLAACALALALVPARAQEFETGVEAAVAETVDGPAPAPASALPDKVDLNWQWIDGPREQKPLGSCHAFAATALLEAAFRRLYGVAIRLSEADLFVRATAAAGPRALVEPENGLLRRDLRLALRDGVLPGDGYAGMAARYKALRKRPLALIRGGAAVRREVMPESATPEAAAEREAVRDALSPVEIGGPSGLRFLVSAARTIVKGRAVRCRSRDKRRDLIAGVLASGRPVGVGLLLNGVSDPDLRAQADAVGGEHYIVLTGYERKADGYEFSIRNSWGGRPGSRAVLREPDLCALYGVTWLSTPDEAGR